MYSLKLLVSFCLASFSAAAALPQTATTSVAAASCVNPPKRQEWRQLSLQQRKSYIDAVLCLTKKAAKSGVAGAVHRYDDYVAVHSSQTPNIHWVGHFILWHRYFTATFEKALREDCGYTGGQPYWDWSLDAEPQNPNSTRVFDSDIFNPQTGFGGNGNKIKPTPEQNTFNITEGTGGGCVQTGPFVETNFIINLPTKGCLRRDFIPSIMNTFADPKLVANVMAQPDYTSWAKEVEGVPSFDVPDIHGSGHFGVGGVLGTAGNAANSPGEPIFYLHHGNLDHLFWQWQQKDLKTRLNQVGGPIVAFDYGGQNVTLDFTINLGKLAGEATLKSLLDTQGGTLCYTY
ncbi:Di-copper centre-containing protein [Clathrospora elynae]|uniref:Di-copper centre-containing protein n=1 Tax=Clathrospora elynae TaxID=706981 RepID=A0A6A5SAC8_9PLEO|nr:Di-copper centre-containing protein [Clathrospora elynae]